MAYANGAFSATAAALAAAGSMICADNGVAVNPVYDTAPGFTSDIIVGGRLRRGRGVNYIMMTSAGASVLAALTASKLRTGVDADNGLFTSAITGGNSANATWLPANFGPGRGNWTVANVLRLKVYIRSSINTISATTHVGGPFITNVAPSASGTDVEISIKNASQVALEFLEVEFLFGHSVEG